MLGDCSDGEVAERCEVDGAVTDPGAAGVFAQDGVPAPVAGVLDAPMAADEGGQAGRVCLFSGQAGDNEDGCSASGAIGVYGVTQDACDLANLGKAVAEGAGIDGGGDDFAVFFAAVAVVVRRG